MTQARDIIETLRYAAETVDVPPPDETELRRRVRRERRRTIRRRAATVGAVAASALVAASAAGILVDLGRGGGATRVETPVAGPPRGVVAEDRPPVFLSVDGRLRALEPNGSLAGLGVAVEEIVGATPDGVLAIDRNSGLVGFRAVPDQGGWRFERVDLPVEGPVQRAAVSQATGLLAWVTLDNHLVIADLDGGRVLSRTPVSQPARLYDVGAGALVGEAGTTRLVHPGKGTRQVWEGPTPWAASTGGDTVAITERGDDGLATRVFEISGKHVREVAELPGGGDLSPDGLHHVTVPDEDAAQEDVPVLWTRDGGAPRAVTGLSGAMTGVAWIDEDTAAVTTRERATGRTDVYTCEAATASCDLALEGGSARVTLTY